MNIQDLLKGYKVNRAKVRIAHLEIEQLQDLLSTQIKYDESTDEVIEGMSLPAVVISDGGGKSGKISSPTESVAFAYLIEWRADPPARLEIRQKITNLLSSIYGMELSIKLVDGAMTALTDRQRFVIEHLYFEGLSWMRVAEAFEQQFEYREEVTLKRYRKEALDKLDEVMRA
jgi:DNA-directed RNA polymerase specialized sigma subunit